MPSGTEKDHDNPQLRIVGVPGESRAVNFHNTSPKPYRLRQLALFNLKSNSKVLQQRSVHGVNI
jgi:hypothetical protein